MLWNKYEILRLLKSFHGEKHSINTSLSKTFIFLLLIPQIPSTEMHVVMCWIKTMTKKSKLKLTLFHTQVQPEHTQLQQLFDSPTWNSGFLFLCSGQQSSHQQTNDYSLFFRLHIHLYLRSLDHENIVNLILFWWLNPGMVNESPDTEQR